MIKSHKLSLMGIVEAKLGLDNVDNTVSHCFPPHWSIFHNVASGCVSRIVLVWDTQLFTVDLILSDAQIMVVKLVTLAKVVFYVSCVYGHNSMVDRRRLWEAMRYVHSIIGDTPWLQLGDFNVVRQMSERLVGFDCNSALEFNSCLDFIEMDDMPFKGLLFTWSNKRGGMGHIKSKIDRVLINGPWLDAFPESETTFLAPGFSDHSFILVDVLPAVHRRRPLSSLVFG